jgi:ligand-binding sensor domain-containing protein
MSPMDGFSKTPPLKSPVVYARQLTVNDGLSSNVVYCLLHDSKGFYWFGTRNGLNKYDGTTFRHYYHTPFDSTGLQSNIIKALAEDKSGVIWIGTTGAGLAKLDRNTDKIVHYRHNDADAYSIGSDNVSRIFVDSKSRLWVGLGNGELDYFEPRSQKFWRYTNVASEGSTKRNNPILSITEDKIGMLCLKKADLMIMFDPSSGHCRGLTLTDSRNKQEIESGRAEIMYEPTHDLWLATVDSTICTLRSSQIGFYSESSG